MENQEKSFWEKMKHSYRLVIMNNETFEEMGSYKLSLLNFYVLFSTVVVIVAILLWMLITYTPIKQYIPGYQGGVTQDLVGELVDEVKELEKAAVVREKYLSDVRRMLTANVETQDTVETVEVTATDSNYQIAPSEEEVKLRKEVQLEEIESQARQPIATNPLAADPSLAEMHFIPPVSGQISKPFDMQENHFGVDLIAPKNTAIKVVLDGFVFFRDFTMDTGNVIGVQHKNNTVSFYKHNSELLKEVGSFVKAGEAIAIIGNTGVQSDGPHLHFELWHNGQPLDPTEYVSFD